MAEEQTQKETSQSSEQEKDPSAISEEMNKVILDLKTKMQEIDRITLELDRKRAELEKNTPKKTQRILEEIKVPSLEMLK